MKVGIIGASETAKFLAQAGHGHGKGKFFEFAFIATGYDAVASPFGMHLPYSLDQGIAKKVFLNWSDVVTYEPNAVSVSVLKEIEKKRPVFPSSKALGVLSDGLIEKSLLNELQLPTPRHQSITSIRALKSKIFKTGFPAVLKPRSKGHAKSAALIEQPSDIESAWYGFGQIPCLLEQRPETLRDLSIIGIRNAKGQMVTYPISQIHGIPGDIQIAINTGHDPLQSQADTMIQKIMNQIQYVGVLVMRFSETSSGISINSLVLGDATSGHWTACGCQVSQHENHLLALSNAELIEPQHTNPTAMICPSDVIPNNHELTSIPGVTIQQQGLSCSGHILVTGNHAAKAHFYLSIRQALAQLGAYELAKEFSASSQIEQMQQM